MLVWQMVHDWYCVAWLCAGPIGWLVVKFGDGEWHCRQMRVYGRAIEQPRIRSAVREVAGRAAFGLDDIVLIDKRPGCLGVALGADRIHLRRGTKILLVECAVRIVAVGALHQSFFHLVMEGHVELRLGVGVALEAEFRLRNLQQLLLVFAVMNAVAADAAHVVLAVRRALEVGMLALVAAQAPRIDFLRRMPWRD